MKLAIKNGRLICPASQLDKIGDIAIENGKIAHLGTIPAQFVADKTIDASKQWVIPGLIDLCCRPQMPHPSGSTLKHEAKAALMRGITSLCIPPDGNPLLDNPQNALRLQQSGDENSPDLYPIGALTTGLIGESIADLTQLAQAGCIAFSNAQHPIRNLNMLRNCYEYAASFGLMVVIQPQDPALAQRGVAHEGFIATRLGLPGIPETAETVALVTHLLLIQQTGVRAHFTCLSSARAIDLIAQAKAKNLPVTCDCSMHQLHLTENDLGEFDANCHVYPPLRNLSDKNALVAGIQSGVIDAISSDHRPLDSTAKLAPFGDTIPGMSTLDTFLSLGIHLVNQKQLSAMQLINSLTYRAAQIFNLPKGTLREQAIADICIVDPERYWVVSETTMTSGGKNSAFKGWEIPGVITHTIQHGQIVHAA